MYRAGGGRLTVTCDSATIADRARGPLVTACL
jgi:hypothetical protein